jgi:hypothetical protein
MPKLKEIVVALRGQPLLDSILSKNQMTQAHVLGATIVKLYNDVGTVKETCAALVVAIFPIGADPSGEKWQDFARGMSDVYGVDGTPSEYVRRCVGDAYKASRVDDDGKPGELPVKGNTSGNGKGNAAKGKSPKRGASSLVKRAKDNLAYIMGLASLDINEAKFELVVTAGEAMLAAAEGLQAAVNE